MFDDDDDIMFQQDSTWCHIPKSILKYFKDSKNYHSGQS